MIKDLEKQISTYDPLVHDGIKFNLLEAKQLLESLRELKLIQERYILLKNQKSI